MPRSCRGRTRTIARVDPPASARHSTSEYAQLSWPPDRLSGPPDAVSGPPDTRELVREANHDVRPLSRLDRDAPLDDDRSGDHHLTDGPHARHHRLMPHHHRVRPRRDLLEHETAA